jgi:polar amino acid transport system substrate-binding protein
MDLYKNMLLNASIYRIFYINPLGSEQLQIIREFPCTYRRRENMRNGKLKKVIAMTMIFGMVATGCGSTSSTTTSGDATQTPDDTMVYAVEAGSAGEEVATELGYTINSVASQADALMEVASGTSDAAIIDLLMAGAMIGEGTSYPNLTHTDELTTEEYGVGCRKGSDLAAYINEVFYQTYLDGTMKEIATTYGVQESLVEQPESSYAATDDGDVASIKTKGTLIVGITDFEPMDYKDDAGEWIGFDADMAKLVAEKLGVEVQFVEIDWDNKIMELESGNIDVVWNGMTLTSEVKNAMECTNAYCNNAQVVVVPAN